MSFAMCYGIKDAQHCNKQLFDPYNTVHGNEDMDVH